MRFGSCYRSFCDFIEHTDLTNWPHGSERGSTAWCPPRFGYTHAFLVRVIWVPFLSFIWAQSSSQAAWTRVLAWTPLPS